MDDAIPVKDVEDYIQRRRASLASRRDATENPSDKVKVIGMLQTLADFEEFDFQPYHFDPRQNLHRP